MKLPRRGHNREVASQSRLARCIAQAIRERRESLGAKATQEEIAHKTHISVRTLQRIEQGSYSPRLETLLALAEALKTNAQTLLDRADELANRKR